MNAPESTRSSAQPTLAEHALTLGPTRMVGILTPSPRPRDLPAVIIPNSGLVPRVGPSRLSVNLARRLAAQGYPTLRFDHAGVGDSNPRQDDLSFDQCALEEVGHLMDDLERDYGLRRFVILGLCSGAVTAFKAAGLDARVAGAIMINAQYYETDPEWNHHVATQQIARHYWTRSIFRPSAWWRAITGRIHYRVLIHVLLRQARGLFRKDATVQQVKDRLASHLRDLAQHETPLLILNSEGDIAQDYLRIILGDELDRLTESGSIELRNLADTDHTFTLLANQERLSEIIEEWMEKWFGGTAESS